MSTLGKSIYKVLPSKNSSQISERFSEECIDLFAELLKSGKSVRTKTLGGSMYPTILKQDFLTIAPSVFSEMRVGDIVAYRQKGRTGLLTGHRVIRIKSRKKNPFIIAKGDANLFFDNPVYSESVYGKVVQIEREERNISLTTTKARTVSFLYAKYLWYKRYPDAFFRLFRL